MSSLRSAALPLVVALGAAISGAGISGAGISVAQAASSAASGGSCIGVIIDARSVGSDVSTSCVRVKPGASGAAVLHAAGHTLGYRNDGLLCTIDGIPKTGCSAVDDTHYWAYYHRAPGKTAWTYSNEGPDSYQPVSGSTEGWVYDDGSSLKPENVPYQQICHCKPAASPTPTPSRSVTPKPTHKASTKPSHPSSPTPAPSHEPTAPASPTPTPTESHRTRSVPPTAKPSSSHDGSQTVTVNLTPRGSTVSPSSAALSGGTASPSKGSPVGLIIGIVAIALLAAAAAYRSRRRRL